MGWRVLACVHAYERVHSLVMMLMMMMMMVMMVFLIHISEPTRLRRTSYAFFC